jgi:hypothetical protein
MLSGKRSSYILILKHLGETLQQTSIENAFSIFFHLPLEGAQMFDDVIGNIFVKYIPTTD